MDRYSYLYVRLCQFSKPLQKRQSVVSNLLLIDSDKLIHMFVHCLYILLSFWGFLYQSHLWHTWPHSGCALRAVCHSQARGERWASGAGRMFSELIQGTREHVWSFPDMGDPQNRCFISWKSPFKWMIKRGTPFSGNPQIYSSDKHNQCWGTMRKGAECNAASVTPALHSFMMFHVQITSAHMEVS